MVERLRHGIAAGLGLQVVVANLLGAVDGLLDVAVLQRTETLVVVVSPHAGIEVSQQFQAHAELIGLGLTETGHLLVHLVEGTRQVFHMVAYLVGDDVCVGKVAVST